MRLSAFEVPEYLFDCRPVNFVPVRHAMRLHAHSELNVPSCGYCGLHKAPYSLSVWYNTHLFHFCFWKCSILGIFRLSSMGVLTRFADHNWNVLRMFWMWVFWLRWSFILFFQCWVIWLPSIICVSPTLSISNSDSSSLSVWITKTRNFVQVILKWVIVFRFYWLQNQRY